MGRFSPLKGLWAIILTFVTLLYSPPQWALLKADNVHQDLWYFFQDSKSVFTLSIICIYKWELPTRHTDLRVGITLMYKMEGEHPQTLPVTYSLLFFFEVSFIYICLQVYCWLKFYPSGIYSGIIQPHAWTCSSGSNKTEGGSSDPKNWT